MKKNRKRKLGLPGTSGIGLDEFDESTETEKFIGESIEEVVNDCLTDVKVKTEKKVETVVGLKPDLLALCTVSEKEQAILTATKTATEVADDLNLEGLDDDEIDGYILTESEAVQKDKLWNKMNAEYLKIAKEREERAAREREEGKPEKKKRRSRKKPIGPSCTALDAIQKVLQEKKISSKINYDILKSLTATKEEKEETTEPAAEDPIDVKPIIVDESHLNRPSTSRKSYFNLSNNRRSKAPQIGFPMASASEETAKDQVPTDTG
jgi:transcription factor IIIB 90 kDa subunit